MKKWNKLDISSGCRSLLEASAGTGKTWTIGVLYLRFLLEKGMTPRQIVVTTFTDAGAQELSGSLRKRLASALALAEGRAEDAVKKDDDILWLDERWDCDEAQRTKDRHQIKLALAELDMAPIGTLHGLCQRILSDHPFAAGTLFSGGDLAGDSGLKKELAKDLYRRLIRGDSENDNLCRLAKAAGLKIKLVTLEKELSKLLMPGCVVRKFDEAELDRLLPQERAQELGDVLGCFTKVARLGKAFEQLANILKDRETCEGIDTEFEKLLKNAPELTGVVKPFKEDPRLKNAAAFAVSVVESGVLHFKALRFWSAVTDWANVQAKARLAARSQRSFDALLTDVHAALHGTAGRALADTLFAAWPVALVDEFQDTDGIQYGILDAIYRDENSSLRGHMAMIGDPKQAIYSFRGGDVRAYARASRTASDEHKIELKMNQRSAKRYVQAMNEWYALCGEALSTDDSHPIQYAEVKSAERHENSPYAIDGNPCIRPLVFHVDPNTDLPGNAREGEALDACARQVSAMLASGSHSIAGKALKPSDIAVLLPKNGHIIRLRDQFRKYGVPCVSMSRISVFDTDAARELLLVLYAVVNSQDISAIMAAIGTRLFGETYADLRGISVSDSKSKWREYADLFHHWSKMWMQRGVQSVINALAIRISAGQLDNASGERTLTDLRHLGELLQAEAEKGMGQEGLLSWMSGQLQSQDDEAEEASENRQLRIESDASRVRLMTLHASKGQEFNIVFLPLMWMHGERREPGLYQGGNSENGMRELELGAKAMHSALQDLQDERFRVLYVALTRAVHACHVYALHPGRPAKKKTKASPEGTACSALDASISRLRSKEGWSDRISASETIDWRDGWPDFEQVSAAHDSPPGDGNAEARAQRKACAMPRVRKGPLPARHSFSSIMKRESYGNQEESAAFDEEMETEAESESGPDQMPETEPPTDAPEQPMHPELSLLMHVAGEAFGNAVHSIFENRMLHCSLAGQIPLIQKFLLINNVHSRELSISELSAVLASRLQKVLDTQLCRAGPRLSELPGDDLRNEMEFNYLLTDADLGRLSKVCALHGEPDLVPVQARRLAGIMNGKIDLVFRHEGRFHVLDYKSNRLGGRLSDYDATGLRIAMDSHHYRFQALLYALAVDRYLAQRIVGYDRSLHLGDCYYLFIRAVGLGDSAGIWKHRFSDALIADVQNVLAGMAVEHAA